MLNMMKSMFGIRYFSDRIEISNSGTPLVAPDRFIDAYLSRRKIRGQGQKLGIKLKRDTFGSKKLSNQ